ncbi:MAG: tRNA pseudouridine(54/55) synthase Pus10 [Methanophagales archaeon]|nr:tRNA pseudouridine(54/55) synthase Pus10 [Methanophagales archaeon]
MEILGEFGEDGLEIARKVTKEGAICDHCLGRQLAKISSGLSNERRGEILKEVLRERGEELKAGKCWVCNGLFEQLEYWVSKALETLRDYEFDSFLVGTKVSGLLLENEELLWEIAGASYAEPLKAELNREVGKRIEHDTGKIVDFKLPDVVVILNLWTETVEVQVKAVFIYGRYRKLTRGISQTRWLCRECRGKGCERCNFTGKMYPESVEELISDSLREEFKGEEMVLHGCGREDIDARMLGSGRPFVLELQEPRRRNVDLRMAEEKVNEENRGKVEVRALRYVNREMVAKIKNAKMDKTYRIEVELKPLQGLRGHGAEPHKTRVPEEEVKNALERLSGALIEQRTPTRVLHRRADLVRKRKVHSVRLVSFEAQNAVMEIKCSAGLYIKELISGDEGRTKPSFSELLGVEAEVKELDVLDVDLDREVEDFTV